MTHYDYTRAPDGPAPLGLVVLQADETIEADMRRMMPPTQPLFVSRVPSAAEVTPQSLRAMAGVLRGAAAVLPDAQRYHCVGYGCTSATAEIGADEVAQTIRAGCDTARVSDPLTALTAAASGLGLRRIAFLSPYTVDVSDRLRAALEAHGIATPTFGSFDEPNEQNVVRIDPAAIRAAACDLAQQESVDGVFLSCTNLRTLDVIEEIEAVTGVPCLSSNQVLAWHMCAAAQVPGRLGRRPSGG